MIKFRCILFILILFFTINLNIVEAKTNKLTNSDYVKIINEYEFEANSKLSSINEKYNNEIKSTKKLISDLKDEKHKAYMNWNYCDEQQAWNSMAKGKCGKYIGKTTLLKTQSGLVVADDHYALNKCLAKEPIEKNPPKRCPKEWKKYEQIEQEYKKQENRLVQLENEKQNELNQVKNEYNLFKKQYYEECVKNYPHRNSIYGYCSNLSP